MKKIKVDKVILYYMDRVDPDGNLYRFYVYKDMASEIEYFCTEETGNMTIPIGEGKYIEIVPREIVKIPVRGYVWSNIKKLWIMDIVSKYTALLGQQKLKESFVKDLELVLSRKDPNIEKGKLNFIRYSEMKNWSVRELFGEDLEQADRALINKVYHMLFDIGSDFESVIRMLYSFRNGPKSGIKVADPEDNYEWTNKDGNEKYSTKNLPKAHFRWDWRRYTLSKESVDKITEFVDTILES